MKTSTLKFIMLLGLFFSTTFITAQNLLTDGGFNTTSVITPLGAPPVPLNTWCSWHDNAMVTSFTTDVSAGVCSYSFFNSGPNTWDVQLIQYGFPLVLGNHYRLTFDVRADADRSFGVYIGEESGSWTNLNAANYFQTATTGWQTKTIEFDATAVFALHKLSFEMGAENIPMYFDNIILENLWPHIEIIGTSIPPDYSFIPPLYWNKGVDVPTVDGIIYTLSNIPLAAGMLKFRQNQTWGIDWGSISFPTGFGTLGGSNIPVAAGTYTISFNRLTSEYNFGCVTCTVPEIGIIGSSVPPYDGVTVADMNTTDGNIYTLINFPLSAGNLKFRQDKDLATQGNQWNEWGGSGFPNGVGNSFGSINIPYSDNFTITYNRLTGEYSFACTVCPTTAIGIIGSAVPIYGWSEDVDMSTTDGINYTLLNYSFVTGEVKFRQDNDWGINWGNTDFPSGYGYGGGPNIPVPAGNYNVYFNRYSGWYNFSLACPDPILRCNADTVVYAAADTCGSFVTYNFPVILNECGNNYIYQYEGFQSGAFFPVGTTINSFIAYNSGGQTAYCSFSVTVKDKVPPLITEVSATPNVLWPPNHKMKNVTINYNTWDNCGPVSSSLAVSSNEPEYGTGNGDAAPDWIITDNHHLQLRAERAGSGNGRIYSVTITSTDAAGNTSTQNTNVVVPHNINGAAAKGYVEINGDYNEQQFDCFVSPNPSSQYFNMQITATSNKRIEVSLLEISGRLISTLNTTTNQLLRFGENLKPGIYIAQIRMGEQRKIIKLLKQ